MLLQLLQLNQEDSVLTAFQICFDLCENDDQKFLAKLLELLPQPDAAVADAPVLSEQALAAVVTAKVSLRSVVFSSLLEVTLNVPLAVHP